MLLTITTTSPPASDLGYLLHKHPDRLQSFDVAGGVAHVFYPQAGADACTAALLMEIDPVKLDRGRIREGFALGRYVNDRPYAASSLLSVALAKVFRTALSGRCDARPELAQADLDLRLHLPAVPCRGGADLAHRLFAPLGWQVTAAAVPLDEHFPDWGDSPYLDLRLSGRMRLAAALHHIYVLLPVLDDAKHYWVGTSEIDKLIRAGAGWLAGHPERELISRRYLAHDRPLIESALSRLDGDVESEPVPERSPSLAATRRDAVVAALHAVDAARVVDLGCGEGALLAQLRTDSRFTELVGVDVSARALERAARRLDLESLGAQRRLTLYQSALTYRDPRLSGMDAAVLMEVIEHLDPEQLPALERGVFGDAAPGAVIVTAPNAEYNVRYPALAAGAFRHSDHRFEWTRQEFGEWASTVGRRYGYRPEFRSVGEEDSQVGSPTQLAIFRRDRA
ncbi:MAG TPA: 3' terminal RNA ribose 2'-O-methyltransferase Hen1 [Mycobacteriales bacterium]|nr:3' terminal RNA ribose 2'-O-methyltransferase Hen1 [Mycobacteriales bacterium]